MILLRLPKSMYQPYYGDLIVSALEVLKREIEQSKRLRQQNVVELKNSFSFEMEAAPKLRNMLFQEMMKKRLAKLSHKSRK